MKQLRNVCIYFMGRNRCVFFLLAVNKGTYFMCATSFAANREDHVREQVNLSLYKENDGGNR